MDAPNREFVLAGSLEELKAKGRLVLHGSHRPILVIYDRGRVFALDNRCPHMGFPLERGTQTQWQFRECQPAQPASATLTVRRRRLHSYPDYTAGKSGPALNVACHGPAVLLLHGFGDTGDVWVSA
jgi:hypothetical protein